MSDEHGKQPEAPEVTPSRTTQAHDTRAERRALRGAARRRRVRTRFWLVAGPVVLVIAAVVVVLVLLGGRDGAGVTEDTSTTVATVGSQTGDLLVVEQDGSALLFIAVRTQRQEGLVLAMPGITLVKTDKGFLTLADMYGSGDEEMLLPALDEELGVSVETVASVEWPGLRDVMLETGVVGLPPARLDVTGAEAEQTARCLLAFLEQAGPEGMSDAWERLELQGDATQFRNDLASRVSSPPAAGWTAGAVTGRLVEGDRFSYLEPRIDRLTLLLAGPTEGDAITVEIQNGAGMVGVVESAIGELRTLGYTLVPGGNSSDFPGVEETRIVVAGDAAAAGARVRVVLGAGVVIEDDMLEPGSVVVVLGRDYVAPEPASTDSTR